MWQQPGSDGFCADIIHGCQFFEGTGFGYLFASGVVLFHALIHIFLLLVFNRVFADKTKVNGLFAMYLPSKKAGDICPGFYYLKIKKLFELIVRYILWRLLGCPDSYRD